MLIFFLKLRNEADYDGPNPLVVYKAPVPRFLSQIIYINHPPISTVHLIPSHIFMQSPGSKRSSSKTLQGAWSPSPCHPREDVPDRIKPRRARPPASPGQGGNSDVTLPAIAGIRHFTAITDAPTRFKSQRQQQQQQQLQRQQQRRVTIQRQQSPPRKKEEEGEEKFIPTRSWRRPPAPCWLQRGGGRERFRAMS